MKSLKRIPDWLIGVVVGLCLLLAVSSERISFFAHIEDLSFDVIAQMRAPVNDHPDIEIVSITDEEFSPMGPLLWRRDILAGAIENLSLAGARVIAVNIPLRDPTDSQGLRVLQRVHEQFAAGTAPDASYARAVTEGMRELDHDELFRTAVEKAGNVVLPVHFRTRGTGSDRQVPDFIAANAFEEVVGSHGNGAGDPVLRIPRLSPIHPPFARAAAGLGFLNRFPDEGRTLRHQVHVVEYLKGVYVPSFPLAIVRLFKSVPADGLKLVSGSNVTMESSEGWRLNVPAGLPRMTAGVGRYRWNSYSFTCTPLSKVLLNQVPTSQFRDKIVLVGPVDSSFGAGVDAMAAGALPGLQLVAGSVADLLDGRFASRPVWAPLAEIAAVILAGLILILVYPRMTGRSMVAATVLLIAATVTVAAGSLASLNVWLRLTPAWMSLALGAFLIASKRLMETGFHDADPAGSEAPARETATAPPRPGGSAGENPREDPPCRIGRYRIGRELKGDGTGRAFKGYDRERGRPVMIRTFGSCDFPGPVARTRRLLLERVRFCCGFHHPNLLRVLECGEAGGEVFVAAEYVAGPGLGAFATPGWLLPAADALRVAAHAALGLHDAHKRGFVHRAVRPDTIIISSRSREVKVAPFGFLGRPSPPGGTVKTVYMAPELIAGNAGDARSDVFSLGAVLFELLTGQAPSSGARPGSAFFPSSGLPEVPGRELIPRLPGMLEKIVGKALEKDAGRRYQSASVMAEHLLVVVEKIDAADLRRL